MAPAVVLWAWWRRFGVSRAWAFMSRAERMAVAVIVLSYAVQCLGAVAGVIAARGAADPLAHVAGMAGLVAVIVAAEYAGHAAAAVLGVRTIIANRRENQGLPCR